MINTSYKLTEPEIYQSLVEISKSRFITNLMRIIGFVLLAIMLFITITSIRTGTYNFSLGFLFPIFFSIYLIFLPEITAKFQVPNLISKKNPFTETVQIKIYETGFKVKGESFANQFSWEKLNSIIETKDFFLLKQTEIIATVIPKRVLTTDDLVQLKGIISAVSGPKIKLAEV